MSAGREITNESSFQAPRLAPRCCLFFSATGQCLIGKSRKQGAVCLASMLQKERGECSSAKNGAKGQQRL